MENKYLQPILQAGLLDLGDSDERLANIEKSIADLEAKLKKEQHLLPAYTLVTLDPNIHPDDPVLIEAETIVATHWKALRAKFSERPIPILRAVILHALYNIGIKDAKIARIIYLTAANFYPYAKLDREKSIVEEILVELAEVTEKNAIDEWSFAEEEPKMKLSTLKINDLKFGKIEIDKSTLSTKINEALSSNPEGYGPQHGLHNTQYQGHFKEKLVQAISLSTNSAFNKLNNSFDFTALEDGINKFFTDFKKSLDQSLKVSFTSIQAVERRSKLLWWKETLYSASLKDSYRSVNEILQPLIMSKDLYQQLPEIVPISVDYLLKDTLLLVNDKAGEKIPFSKLLDQLSKAENTAILKNYFEDMELVNKRISITDFITLLINGKVQASSLKQYTGIDEKEQISLTDFSVILLHDLMAEYLIPKSK